MQYTVTKNGDTCVATLNGSLKSSDQGNFKPLLEECLATGAGSYRVDLAGVDHIDSTGLGLLLMLQDAAKKAGAKVTLANPAEGPLHAFRLARFDELFTLET